MQATHNIKQTFVILIFALFQFVGFSATAENSCVRVFEQSSRKQSSRNVSDSTEEYLRTTLFSLEKMRGENGLVKDAVILRRSPSGKVRVETLNPDTSPTNIAVDLLIQIELIQRDPKNSATFFSTLNQIVETLENVPHHQQTGLFYSRYTTETRTQVADRNVSSIDNLHLALALWTLKETVTTTSLSQRAEGLLNRMDFSAYYDPASGLIGGNLRYANKVWIRESYNFANLGSEARALYILGPALGLFRKLKTDEAFFRRALSALKIEMVGAGDVAALRLWDGAAFQLFFPKIFINEELYSPRFRQMFVRAGDLMVEEGQRRGLATPAAHSPSFVFNESTSSSLSEFRYKDKTGNLVVVSTDARDKHDATLAMEWESTFTPYALFMAATANPSRILPFFHGIESLGSGNSKLYDRVFGWMDAYHLEGNYTNQAVPVQLALNQGMIALSLLQIGSVDGLSPSGRALWRNAEVRTTLAMFYQWLDQKLAE